MQKMYAFLNKLKYAGTLCLVLLLLLQPTLVSKGFCQDGEKQITREVDPIVLTFQEFPSLLGTPIKSFRLVALKKNNLEPIPFQIDERDINDVYIFRTSHPDIQDKDKGIINKKDELAIMARDLGNRLPASEVSEKKLLAEIELTDPADGSKGWCYVATEKDFPQLSPVDYVTYDPKEDSISTRNYRIGFSKIAPISYGHTTLTPEGGGNNARINERVVTRLKASFLRFFKLSRSEEDFRSNRIGYIDGPVRIIKRVGNSMRQVFGMYGPEVVIDYTFYYSTWIMPNIIDLPVDVKKFVSSLSLRGGTDWTKEATGMVFYTKYIPPGIAVIDGRMSEAEKNMDLRLDIDHIWHLYTGALNNTGQGSILYRIIMDETLQKTIQVETYFYDKYFDKDFEEDPFSKDDYKRFFEGSYLWKGMENLPKGRYYLQSWATIMPDYKKVGDEEKYLDILDKPLQVEIRSFQG